MRSWSLFILFFLFCTGVYAQSFNDNFDASSFKSAWSREGTNTSLSTSKSISGSSSFRAYLTPKVNANPRSELRFNGGNGVPKHQTLLTTWGASLAIYIPSDFQPDNSSNEIIFQYHGKQDSHDTYTNPPVSVQLVGDKLRLLTRWIKRDPGTNNDKVGTTYNMGQVTPGKWHYFVLDVNWDYRATGNGFVKVYMRKGAAPTSADLIGYHDGPVGSKDDLGPYFKVGIYKWDWKKSDRVANSKNSGVTKRELFYDNVRVQKGAIIGGNNVVNDNPSVTVSGAGILTLPTNAITLTANASDSDGSISSYNWTKVSGPAGSLSGKNSSKLSISNMVAGTYQFSITVQDNKGATATTSHNVLVRSSIGGSGNASPTVSAGTDKALPSGSFASFTASASDSDGTIKSYTWSKVSGPPVTLVNTDRKKVNVRLPDDGTYVLRVTVTDNDGAKASDDVKLVIGNGGSSVDDNDAPTVSAGNDKSLPLGSFASFIATASDSDGSIVSYKWTKVSGPSVTLVNTDTEKVNVRLPGKGTYVLRVTVTDNDGNKASDNVKLVIGDISSAMASNGDEMGEITIRNFTTKTDSLKLIEGETQNLKVSLQNVNGIKVSIDEFDGELKTEVLREGIYRYNVSGEDGNTVQKGTILIY